MPNLKRDEPTGNLDRKNAENVFNIFKDLSEQQGLSLLIVTHDLDFANKTDRIIEMGDGRIINGNDFSHSTDQVAVQKDYSK